jgi:hypothetical protein
MSLHFINYNRLYQRYVISVSDSWKDHRQESVPWRHSILRILTTYGGAKCISIFSKPNDVKGSRIVHIWRENRHKTGLEA